MSMLNKLTAEQVREAIEANSWKETSMLLEFGNSSWQAIADELNASLGRGECEMLPADCDKTCIVRDNRTGITMQFGYWKCSACGCNNFEGAKHCMECGRKAVER